jgi:hypothetical protein
MKTILLFSVTLLFTTFSLRTRPDGSGGVKDPDTSGNARSLSTLRTVLCSARPNDTAGFQYLVAKLKEENDRVLSGSKCEKTMAGLLAVINTLKTYDPPIPGNIFQVTLNRYNPAFRATFPFVYSFIGDLTVRKMNGIVYISSADSKPMNIERMRIDNNAMVQVSELPNGNIRVGIIYGIRVGIGPFRYTLNYVILQKETGNLLFDYKDTHSQVTYNLRNDIMK